MFPYLFDKVIFGHHVHPPTYGLMLALAFTAGYFEALRRAKKLHDKQMKHVENLFLLVLVASVLGSRLFHVLFEEFDYYAEHPAKIFAVWEGGYTFYGAALMGLLFMFLYARRHRLDYAYYGDIAGPSTMLGLAIGRMGCFFAGCCWGRPTKAPWGVVFNDPDSFCTVKGIPIHPTQIYEAAGALLRYFYLLWLFRRRQYVGQILVHTMIGYGILRFIIEFFRGDDYRGYIFNGMISYSQLVSLFLVPFAIAAMVVYGKKRLPLPRRKR